MALALRYHPRMASPPTPQSGALPYLPLRPHRHPGPDRHVAPDRLVAIYLLEVAEVLPDWEEAGQRRREWVPAAEAADRMDEPGLAELVRSAVGGLVGR